MKRESIFRIFAFSLTIFVTQIGSLERERASWDESTYIVIAAHVLDGNLPYVGLYDLEPPMIYLGSSASPGSPTAPRAGGARSPP